MDQQLIALYEIKRQSFLIGYIQNPPNFSPALAYAYYARVAPIFHENIARERYGADPFEGVYSVKASFIDEVTKYVDECDRAGDLTAIVSTNLRIGLAVTRQIESSCSTHWNTPALKADLATMSGRQSRPTRLLRRTDWPARSLRKKFRSIDAPRVAKCRVTPRESRDQLFSHPRWTARRQLGAAG
ncbi:hypothetical protein [Paraburkholderia aromaticivorans]|uniref:hypothetical protein n=1 Tax=Paraburkholderia aromaticivorans TaxID=2026199 RepID=UPI001F109F0A|nr:hypothetical protein [Paraburkholderia aromaticivorans]